MKRLIFESLLLLVQVDHIIGRMEFEDLRRTVSDEPVQREASKLWPYESLCLAMDYACVFHLKRVLCLQRSAATVLLLRRHGWGAEMVIGAQMLPFKSHAWCEINGAVVNDKPYVSNLYQVLDRC
jgi:hypothetical protein